VTCRLLSATARESEKRRFSGKATISLGCCDHNFLLSPESGDGLDERWGGDKVRWLGSD
jgi:hypothetical protein